MTSRSRLLFSGHSCSKLTGSQRRVAPSHRHSSEGTAAELGGSSWRDAVLPAQRRGLPAWPGQLHVSTVYGGQIPRHGRCPMHTVPRARPRGMTRESVGRGRSFCAVVTGPEEAAGQTVDVKGHAVSLKPGKCSPLMMGGKPFLEQKPKDMQTSNDSVVHWDGKVWSI